MICAIVLAAGQSRRMGTQKLLLPFAGQTVIGHVVDQVLGTGGLRSARWHGRDTVPQQRDDMHGAPIGQVLVIVPELGDGIRQALAGKPVSFVANPDPASDMLSSVRCGLRALPAGCAAVLVVLGDQPAIPSQLIGDIARTFETTGARIVVPVFNGRRGHPILFSADYVAEVLTDHDTIGLRGLLQAHAGEIHLVDVADSAVLSDIDYPDDYQRELARLLEADRQ